MQEKWIFGKEMQLLVPGLVQYIPWSKHITNTDTLVNVIRSFTFNHECWHGGRERELVAHKRDTHTNHNTNTFMCIYILLSLGTIVNRGRFQTRFGNHKH